ncbi:hypothetical protein D3C85_333720 [compost metagenome]
MNALLIWWCSVTPKAKWLIVWSTIYAIASLGTLIVTGNIDYLMYMQVVWVFISAMPLWYRPLANWLQMRPKITDWFKRKLK